MNRHIDAARPEQVNRRAAAIIRIPATALLVILAACILAGAACRRRPGSLPATIVWGQDQVRIHPPTGTRNVWEGWTIAGKHFEAVKSRSRFIFWRKRSGRQKLRITYSLKSRPGILMCNDRQIVLPPADSFATVTLNAKLFQGYNIIETFKQTGDVLKIREIVIGGKARRSRHLLPGEHMIRYFSPGSGSLRFRGRGTLLVEKTEARAGVVKSESRSIKTGFLQRGGRHDFAFEGIGTLKTTVKQGEFDIIGHEFIPAKPDPLPPPAPLELKPDVFIFLIDACQAKHLSVYGYHRPTSPAIDALARDGIVFENAYANATFTPASVGAILSGQYPERNSLRIQIDRLPESAILMPEFMKARGYRTAVFSSSINCRPLFGFGQGVDDFVGRYMRAQPRGRRRDRLGSAPPLTKEFLRWLDKPGPRFAYLHFMEPHWPLLPPPPFRDMFKGPGAARLPEGFYARIHDKQNDGYVFSEEEIEAIRADYDSAIAHIDFQLGEIWNRMRETGLYDESVIILLADHGEAFFEHGQVWSHGTNVYDETTHVPLIVKLPKDMNAKGRVSSLVQLVDIFPTVAGLFGETVETADGRDILRLLGRESMDDTFAVSRTGWFYTKEEPAAYSMRWRNWYYVHDMKTRTSELFRLDEDPGTDVLSRHPRMAAFFLARFLDWYQSFPKLDIAPASLDFPAMSPEERETLKSLGYL